MKKQHSSQRFFGRGSQTRSRKMSRPRTSSALITSLIIHVVIAVIIAVYLVTQTQPFKDFIGLQVLEAKQPAQPKVRKPIVKPVERPTVRTTNPLTVQRVDGQPRKTTLAAVRPTGVQPPTRSEYSNHFAKPRKTINPSMPHFMNSNTSLSQATTYANLPLSDAPDVLLPTTPVVTGSVGDGNVGGESSGIGRGIGGQVQVKVAKARPPGLAMVEQVGAAKDVLSDVVRDILLGSAEVRPLPRGEPGGRVVGRGRDVRGVFRFTRVRHNLSDWWADASALTAFTKWLNARTKIRTDMNVEGGAVYLTDANLMKSPLLIMTGHDPTLRNRQRPFHNVDGRYDNRLSDTQAVALRRYFIERGGLLVFDDCGFNSPTQAMTELFLAAMRNILPEHPVERIANGHEIYNNFYQMGGPPIGFNIFWWGTNPPDRNYLEGISIGDKLSAIVIRRDYMCAMETVSFTSRSAHYSPGVYRFMTNVVVYALTHGKIADYSGYVPEKKLDTQKIPTRAPPAARIETVE